MMHKRSLLLVSAALSLIALFAAGLYAASDVPDIIKMENKAYEKHTKAIVEFHHKKHAETYAQQNPKIYDLGCGECHHDDKGKPLTGLKAGDPVKGCIECHSKPGELIGTKAKGLTDKQKLEFHANAVHENCRSCHRDYNKEKNLKSKDPGYAPISCNSCHKG
ncbi:MAG: cytochrome C [Desulfobacteraceae bacterium]|nr:MAG: cytochrome C [Desulfobacteraceae bacterium]